jgi:uncharacterized C2H2 Zn-finger protein
MRPGLGSGMGFPRRGLGGFIHCECPRCGYLMAHRRGIPCNLIRCPECGSMMIGKED